MPTYQYECEACQYSFEELQGMTDPKLTKCPKCGKKKLARLIGGGSGMIFKGSGFYQTDYKKKSAPSTSAKGGSAPGGDSKPASTPAPSGGCGGGCACHPQ